MKEINASAVIMPQLEPYKHIEQIGRICYKSEEKIGEGTAKPFVDMLVKRNHLAMLEHSSVYVVVSSDFTKTLEQLLCEYREETKYLRFSKFITKDPDDKRSGSSLLSGPLRAFIELFTKVMIGSENLHDGKIYVDLEHDERCDLLSALNNVLHYRYDIIPLIEEFKSYYPLTCQIIENVSIEKYIEDLHLVNEESVLMLHMTHTVRFICDRGVSHELVRHRPCSFAQESTRYCNYSLDKFGKEITFIRPLFFKDGSKELEEWRAACREAELRYFNLLDLGAAPQQARDVLPTSVKTEIVITANEVEWQHMINLRHYGTTGAPHPQMSEVFDMVVDDLIADSNYRLG